MGAVLADHVLELSLLPVLLALSAFFSGSETALFSLTREQLRAYERNPGRTGRHILALLGEPRMLLATVLMGNTLVNLLFYSISFRLAQSIATVSPWVGRSMGIVPLFLVIIFGEVAPKGLAMGRPETFARAAAAPLYWFQRAVRPAAALCVAVVRLVTERLARRAGGEVYVTAEELKMLVEMAESQHVLGQGARAMIQDVLDLSRTRVKQIMLPRVDMARFSIDEGREAFLELVRATRHKRYPVCTQTLDDAWGVLHVRDVLLNPEAELRTLVKPVMLVPETKTVESLLREFRERRVGMALVVDEYGGTAGMVTIEDILEEIVGEIRDEYDQPTQEMKRVEPDTYVLPGKLPVESWRAMFGIDLPAVRADTMGGLVTALLGRVPGVGDTAKFGGLEFTAESVRHGRVERVRVRLLPEGEKEAAP